MRSIAGVVSALAIALVSATAAADVSKAWQAARDNLPESTVAVGAIDVGAIIKAKSFPTLLAAAVKEERDLAEIMGIVKAACQLDAAATLEGVVVAGDPAAERGAVYLQLAIDRARATACIEAIVKVVGDKSVTVRQDGIYTVISEGVDDETVHLAWVAPNVVVIPMDMSKADAEAWTGHKGAFARSLVAKRIAKLDTKAIAWGAFASATPLDDDDLAVTGAHGSVLHAKGMLTAVVRGTFVDANAAKRTIGEMQRELTREIGRKRTPPALVKLLRTIKVRAVGTEGLLDAKTTEAAFAAAIAASVR